MSVAEIAPEPVDAEAEARAKLRAALEALREDERRLAAVDQARWRADDQRRAARDAVDEAQVQLDAAQLAERERLVNDFVTEVRTSSLVKPAQNALEAAQSNLRRFTEIEQALISEADALTRLVERRRHAVSESLAALITSSPEFHALFDQLDAVYSKLRGLKKSFHLIHHACGGYLPQQYLNRWQATPSLAFDVKGAVVDPEPAQAWSEALQRLLDDPGSPLPDGSR